MSEIGRSKIVEGNDVRKAILFLVALILPAVSLCDPLEGFFDKPLNQGFVGSFNEAKQTLVVSDILYHLNGATRIENPNMRLESARTLKPGQRVAFDYLIDQDHRRLLTRIRLLPNETGSP